jgi:hypothetical protein
MALLRRDRGARELAPVGFAAGLRAQRDVRNRAFHPNSTEKQHCGLRRGGAWDIVIPFQKSHSEEGFR